ncbi:MAG TPA: hypothetical protein PKA59_04480 [Chakrabartia sp.]|jgi:hypothetical protein|nr:hypothetical protein [Chakrabartia sp.]
MSRLADPHRALERALSERLASADAIITASRTQPWASATFSGARHEFELHLEGQAACRNAQAFSTKARHAEFDLPGHIVADFNVRFDSGSPQQNGSAILHIEALTVEAV